MKKLHELTEKQFNTLKEGGMLKDFYPDAPEKFTEITGSRPKPKAISEIKIDELIDLMESVFDDYENLGYSKDADHFAYEALVNVIYGSNAWEWINNIDDN